MIDNAVTAAPLAAIKKAEQRFGRDIWQMLDACEQAKADGAVSWPDYCPLPISAALEALMYRGQSARDAAFYASELAALWAWRRDKIIYQFDPDLAEELAATGIYGAVPVDPLLHLPHNVIYIRSSVLPPDISGAFAWVEYDLNRKEPELRLQLISDPPCDPISQVCHLINGKTLQECVDLATIEAERNTGHKIDLSAEADLAMQSFATVVPLILYLCTDEPDITYHPAARHRQRPRDTPSEVAVSEVGARIGAAFRRARQEERTASVTTGAGSAKRPHARRGHWHHFWVGPLTGERRLILKWIPPIIVHADKITDDVSVVQVKGDTGSQAKKPSQ